MLGRNHPIAMQANLTRNIQNIPQIGDRGIGWR